jgi:uncharacterized protein YgiM (DUF1202 family)
MKQWLLMLTVLVLSLAGMVSVQAQDETADTFLCENADDRSGGSIVVTGGLDNIYDPSRNLTGNTYCRILVLNNQVRTQIAEVGNLEAVERGILQAVDVVGMFPEGETWNSFRASVRVCLRGEGDIQFLDAFDSTRTIRTLFAFPDAALPGLVCAEARNAGTVLLTPHGADMGASAVAASSTSAVSTAAADPNSVIALENCQVVTTFNGLFLRREPNTDARIRWQFEDNQTLNATGIAGNWYRIDFRGEPGWVAAAYVTPIGNCLAPDGNVVGTDDPNAPGDATTYTGLTNCQITTNVNGVNLRTEPSLRGSIRWTFEDSQTLDAVGVTGNWYLIAFRGSPGWINGEFVDAEGDCLQPAA